MSLSILGVFTAGLLTFLSPCVLPLAPVFTASLLASSTSRWARLLSTFWFALGFTLAFVAMGLGISALFGTAGALKPVLLGIGGVILALFGLKMMGVIKPAKYFQWMNRSLQLPGFMKRLPGGLHGFVFGLVFGLSWTPCVGPVLGGVLTYVASQERSPAEGALLLSMFSLGISLPLFAVAAASNYVGPFLNRFKGHLPKLEYAVGIGVFVFGIYMVNQGRLQIPAVSGSGQNQVVEAVTDSGEVIDLFAEDQDVSRMVFFYSNNCPVCQAMKSYLPEFEESCTSERFRFHRVNVDQAENSPAASYFNVKAVPTVSVLNEKGDEVVHLVGYQTQGRLREAARTMSQTECQDSPSRDSDLNSDVFAPEALAPGESCQVGSSC